MKVLLLDDVEKLGFLGDVVEVKDGYARNYLVPYGLATIPSEGAIKSIAEEKAKRAAERKAAQEKLAEIAQEVDGFEITIEANANEQGHLFGSVSAGQIGEKLRAAEFNVSDSIIVLSDHIKEVGNYDVTLKFSAEVTAIVKLTVVAQGEEIESAEENTEE